LFFLPLQPVAFMIGVRPYLMNMKSKTSRRRFLAQVAATAGAFTILPRYVLGGPKFVAPSGKINIAMIGVGGQGRTNAHALLQHPDAQLIAVADPFEQCDLDPFYYKGLGGRKPVKAEIEKHYAAQTPNFRCADYEDFRVMLEKEGAIDAVLCATPDHLHAYVSVQAMRAGKHVFCEKPLTHNIWEARTVARVAQETGLATQMGNIGHSTDGIRETCEWIWDGAIGTVREVHAWVGANRWNKTLTGRPPETPPLPAGANWDLWIGPREPRPYHPAYTPVTWRDFWAFGGGGLGDFGCHDLDAAMWALDLCEPSSIEAHPAGQMNSEIAPHGEIVYYQFPARGDKPAVKLTWYDGGLMPPRPDELGQDERLPGRGVLFVGDKGLLLCGGAGGKPRLLPDSKMDAYKRPSPTLKRSRGHHRDWLDAIKGGSAASANFAYGAKLTEVTLLGILSLRTGRKIYWDAEKLQAVGAPEADPVIKEQYRSGWKIT
jgi:predicted dehydrogenase